MIFKFLAIVSLLAVMCDIYLYCRVVRRSWSRPWKRTFIACAAAVYVMVLAAVLLYRTGSNASPFYGRMLGWVFVLFFTNLAPKFFYMLFTLPEYVVRKLRKGRRTPAFDYVAAAIALFVLGAMIHGMTWGRSNIEVKRVEIVSERLPASFDPLRVAVFADLHLGNLVNRDRMLTRMVDTINSLKPDIVAQCGDLVNIHSGELDSTAMAILSGIESRYGVFSVLGNHDIAFYISDTARISPSGSIRNLKAKQKAMGWRLLTDATEYIVRGDDSISVSGVNFPANNRSHNAIREDFAGSDFDACYGEGIAPTFNITLSHTPELWDLILERCMGDLTLSGHVHAMQMKLGFGRWVWSPAMHMYEHWSGLYENNGRYLYVNDGMGYVMFPMRINARPEITLITIRRS